MQNLETLKRRIDSTEALRSVVRTMKTLAAVSIRQYEKAVKSLEQYSRTVDHGLQAVMREQGDLLTPSSRRAIRSTGVIVIGSEHGLCGQFNDQIAAYALDDLPRVQPERPLRRIVLLGERALPHFEEAKEKIDGVLDLPGSIGVITNAVQDVLVQIDRWRERHEVDRVFLYNNQQTSAAAYEPIGRQLLPVDPDWLNRLAHQDWPSRGLPMFTMDRRRLFTALIRERLFISIYRAIAQSLASENASRLAAMQAAERNIEERIDELRAQFNLQRQTSITAELLDIVAGFEAITGA